MCVMPHVLPCKPTFKQLWVNSTHYKAQLRTCNNISTAGVRAWKMLTLGATKVDSKLANVRQYEKKGDYRLALDQFIALEPKENLKFLSDMKGVG